MLPITKGGDMRRKQSLIERAAGDERGKVSDNILQATVLVLFISVVVRGFTPLWFVIPIAWAVVFLAVAQFHKAEREDLEVKVRRVRGELFAMEDRVADAPLVASLCDLVSSCGGRIAYENPQMSEVAALSSAIKDKREELLALEERLRNLEGVQKQPVG